jgi:hypothetical protein
MSLKLTDGSIQIRAQGKDSSLWPR